MTARDQTIARIRELPEPLVQEVSDFVEFLLVRSDERRWERLTELTRSLTLADSDFSDYLANLNDYEERLARGEIRW